MKRQIARLIAQSLVLIFPILMITGITSAQQVVSTKAGIIQYIKGDVLWDNGRVQLLPGKYFQMQNGQSLSTKQGRAELLLTPNVYLRLGENGSLRMERNEFNDTQLALEQGSALIEAVEVIKGNRIRLSLSTAVVEINKKGLYRIDASSSELRVYGGEAVVTYANRKAIIKGGRMTRLDSNPKSFKFDINVADSMHQWAGKRSFDLFIATGSTRKQPHWQLVGLGLLSNSNYHMRFYSELYINEWRNKQRAEAQEQKRQANENHEHVMPNIQTNSPPPPHETDRK
jgi:hypothetical protein